MNIWVDAQLPPTLADWLSSNFDLEASALRDLVCRLGIPPQIIWLTCGNVTNRNLRRILSSTLPQALEKLQAGEIIIEISNS